MLGPLHPPAKKDIIFMSSDRETTGKRQSDLIVYREWKYSQTRNRKAYQNEF